MGFLDRIAAALILDVLTHSVAVVSLVGSDGYAARWLGFALFRRKRSNPLVLSALPLA